MLLPSRLAPNEDYASLGDILEVQDIAEATVHLDFWQRGGRPLAVRVRGLSLEAQDQIRMLAARAVDPKDRKLGVKQHWPTFVAMTLAFGLISPTLTPEQAKALIRKNAVACEQLCNFIWFLSAVRQETIDAIVGDLARAEAAAEDAEPTLEPDDADAPADYDEPDAPEPGADPGVDGGTADPEAGGA